MHKIRRTVLLKTEKANVWIDRRNFKNYNKQNESAFNLEA